MKKNNYRQNLIDKTGVEIIQNETDAGTVRTSYLSAGKGTPVILLHGAGAGAVTWYPAIGPVSGKFHVIAPDIVGYGESDKPDGAYDRPFFSSWLKDFMVSIGIGKAHIVGLSQGGAIALQFVSDYPEYVDKLVLVDSAALGAKPSLKSFIGMLWMNIFPYGPANKFFSRYLLFDPSKRDPDHGLYSIEVLKKKGGKKPFNQGKGAAVSEIPQELLSKITNKTLIIWGENDMMFSAEYGKSASKIIPNAEFYNIQEAGHLPLMDQPEIFNNALIDFLTD